MARRLGLTLSLIVLGTAAVGCASGKLRRKYEDLAIQHEELTIRHEQLQREKAQVDAELEACRARCAELASAAARPEQKKDRFPSEIDGMKIRRRGDETVIDIPADLFFSSGSATLSGSCSRSMRKVAQFIREQSPAGMIRVQGHADTDPIRRTRGTFHCNWDLSFKRAHAVMHHLVENCGFDPRRIVCESYGEFHPVDPGNKARNRRVEIVIAQR